MALQIATLNAQGMTNRMKRQQIADWMIRKNIDILCLQETYATAEIQIGNYSFVNIPSFMIMVQIIPKEYLSL